MSDAETLKLKYLGRKGLLARFRSTVDFKSLTPEMRSSMGREFNDIKTLFETKINDIMQKITAASAPCKRTIHRHVASRFRSLYRLSLHPVTLVQMELEQVFKSMGFHVETGFEVETEHYNFDALNTPFDHPAREMQDTFWLTNGMVLRTQTSASQVRAIEKIRCAAESYCSGQVFPLREHRCIA